jgi:hypothetical protein
MPKTSADSTQKIFPDWMEKNRKWAYGDTLCSKITSPRQGSHKYVTILEFILQKKIWVHNTELIKLGRQQLTRTKRKKINSAYTVGSAPETANCRFPSFYNLAETHNNIARPLTVT